MGDKFPGAIWNGLFGTAPAKQEVDPIIVTSTENTYGHWVASPSTELEEKYRRLAPGFGAPSTITGTKTPNRELEGLLAARKACLSMYDRKLFSKEELYTYMEKLFIMELDLIEKGERW